MRSLQDYRNIYKEIADNNNITGDSVELLVQLLANASYINEVENISYVQEASLERSTLINSKIQHCMDNMYSVFRGRCPRVILKFKPTKYFSFNVFDKIITSNSFGVYYLGYYDPNAQDSTDEDNPRAIEIQPGTANLPVEDGFIYAPCTIHPALNDEDTTTIICLLAEEAITKEWNTNKYNTYYVETTEENLSNDVWVKIGSNRDDRDYYDITRIFSDHILKHQVFDLTTTSFGSRLYIADILKTDEITDDENSGSGNDFISIEAMYYKLSYINDYNEAELKKINLRGADMVSLDPDFLISRGYSEITKGVVVISEVDRDGINTIHYKSSRDRFVSSIIRSNSDVGAVLEETYPDKVMPYGTNFIFTAGDGTDSGSCVDLYYVPKDPTNILTNTEVDDFVYNKKAYYITDEINVSAGRQYTAFFNIDLELYKPYTVDEEVAAILETYEKKFNIDLEASIEEIKTLISKISNVKQVKELTISYINPEGNIISDTAELYDDNDNIKPDIYFKKEYTINSIIQTRS